MKIRTKTLWRVPVFCLVASWISFYVTIYLGQYCFVVKKLGDDGVMNSSIDPVASAIFKGTLFLGVLLLGGLWAFRTMTKKEIAYSAGIISAIYLILALLQMSFPTILGSGNFTVAALRNWVATFSFALFKISNSPHFALLASSFIPLLFIPFGRKTIKNTSGDS